MLCDHEKVERLKERYQEDPYTVDSYNDLCMECAKKAYLCNIPNQTAN